MPRPSGRTGFAGFVFDPANARLEHAGEHIAIRPKMVALLAELVAHAGELVDKDELMNVVWPETAVTDSVLAGAVRDLRRILGDDPRQPRVIETVHRRGYRFIAPVGAAPASAERASPGLTSLPSVPVVEPTLVGRREELETLAGWLASALGGERVIGFVVGEAGMGKTTLVHAFCERAATMAPNLRIGIGHGLEWTSDAESSVDPYVPIIEALGRACSGPGADSTVAALRRYAPSWLPLLPGVLDAAEAEAQRAGLGRTTRERLALELGGFLDALRQPLLLLLEDLHWSDASTLDLLTAVARRTLRAPLLVLATYRAAGAAVRRHPVRAAHQTLAARGLSRELWLKPFVARDVESCIRRRWPSIDGAAAEVVARVVLGRTDGNPLFVTTVIDTLEPARFDGVEAGRLEAAAAELSTGIPPGLAQMIDAETGRLREEDRALLEAGSLCGVRFSAEAVAAVTRLDVVAAEGRLDALAGSSGAIRAHGEDVWPDGTIATMYEFAHALYGDVLRTRTSAAGRRHGHSRIAERLSSAWSGREKEIAAELAFHFLAAGRPEEAVPHVEVAATAAFLLGGHVEAAGFLERGIAALETLPTTPDRRRTVMRLQMTLGQIRQAPDGFNAQKAETAYLRALELAESLDAPVEAVVPTLALTSVHVAQGRLAVAEQDAERAAGLLERFPAPPLQFLGNVAIAQVRHHTARLEEARLLLERALDFSGSAYPTFLNFRIHALNYLGLTLAHLGCPDSARRRAHEAMAAATGAGLAFDRAGAAAFACFAAMTVRDRATLEDSGAQAETLGREYGFGLAAIIGAFSRGLVASMDGDEDGGIATMIGAIRTYEQNGNVLVIPGMMSVVANIHLARGRHAEARSLAGEAAAVMDRTGDARFRAEFARIESQAALLTGDPVRAREGFDAAVRIARASGLRWQELRASLCLARLLAEEGDAGGARGLLEPIVAAIDEGRELEDYRDAGSLLASL
jgi:DNA-binding winged helix-turn-helix (wHTH) protein/tetratricopeptide (TPR) repeat protein